MIADLAQRLRGEADVWGRSDPIYRTTAGLQALLREAADAIDSLTLAFTTTSDQADALSDRLAAAERVVEAAREVHQRMMPMGKNVANWQTLDFALAAYEKAYSADLATVDLRITASAPRPEVQGRDGSS